MKVIFKDTTSNILQKSTKNSEWGLFESNEQFYDPDHKRISILPFSYYSRDALRYSFFSYTVLRIALSVSFEELSKVGKLEHFNEKLKWRNSPAMHLKDMVEQLVKPFMIKWIILLKTRSSNVTIQKSNHLIQLFKFRHKIFYFICFNHQFHYK